MVGHRSSFELDFYVKVLRIIDGGGALSQDVLGVGAGEGRKGEAILYEIVRRCVGGSRDELTGQGRMKYTFGSCNSSFSHCSAVRIDKVGSHAVEGSSFAESGVRGVSMSFLT